MQKIDYILVFIKKSYFSVSKEVRLNSTYYLIMKINNKKELINVASNHLADIDYKNSVNIHRKCTSKPYFFLTIDNTIPSNDPLHFRNNH